MSTPIDLTVNNTTYNLLYFSKLSHKLTTQRSSKWPALRKKFLFIQPRCQACWKSTKLEVHHIKPVHLYPELELDEGNLITLCENTPTHCHFIYGHLCNWLAWNKHVIEDTNEISVSFKNILFKRLDEDNKPTTT